MRRAGDPRAGQRALIRSALLALLLLAGLHAGAAPPALESQRALYRQTAAALARGDRAALERAAPRLRDYPLLSTLELSALRARLAMANDGEIDAFLARHAGQRPAEQLRHAWLQRLEQAGRWQDYLRYQPDPPADAAARCSHAWATWQVRGAEAAHPLVSGVWLSPRSLPRSCDRLLAAWSARGHPDARATWRRLDLAMEAGETALARYLARRLDGALRRDADLYLALHEAPARLANPVALSAGEPRHARIAAHALVRLAARDAEAARRAFESLARAGVLDEAAQRGAEPRVAVFDGAAQRAAAPRIALGLAAMSPARALEWTLGLSQGARSDALAEDAVRYALRSGEWPRVDEALEQLPAALAAEPRWLYWSARAAQQRSGAEARVALERARADRSWYGFLASDGLGVPYSMQHAPVAVAAEVRERVTLDPGIRRAREFEQVGELLESRREWAWVIARLDDREREAAAALAGGWGWHTLAISALAQAKSWNDLGLRFPAPFPTEFSAAARREKLEPHWLFAIARQESAMNPGARSPAGALGLMQVMPATAQMTARRAGIPYRGSADLLDPATNVVIGSRYMRMMLDDFGDNRILAAAAYNAGPGRVRQWIGRFPDGTEHDVFVEAIPFRETRQYVQNVLAYAVIYAYLQGRTAPLVSPGERRIEPRGTRAG